MRVLVVFVDHELRGNEMAFEDRLDFFGLDKLIEPPAPPSPGGVEEEEDILVVGGRCSLGLGENFVGSRSGHDSGGREDEEQAKQRQSFKRAHMRSIAELSLHKCENVCLGRQAADGTSQRYNPFMAAARNRRRG